MPLQLAEIKELNEKGGERKKYHWEPDRETKEDGRYGWLCDCPWDSAGIAIILSGEKVEITVQDELI